MRAPLFVNLLEIGYEEIAGVLLDGGVDTQLLPHGLKGGMMVVTNHRYLYSSWRSEKFSLSVF